MDTSASPGAPVEMRRPSLGEGAPAGAWIAGDRRGAFTDYFRAMAHSC